MISWLTQLQVNQQIALLFVIVFGVLTLVSVGALLLSMKERNAAWWAPVMVAFFVVGLLWIVVYYIAGADLPLMKSLGWLNVLVGFGLIGVGFGMSMRWR